MLDHSALAFAIIAIDVLYELSINPRSRRRVEAANSSPLASGRWGGRFVSQRRYLDSADRRWSARFLVASIQGTGTAAFRSGPVNPDGHLFSVRGEYIEVSPPTRLVRTWLADWDGGNATTLTYELSSIDGGTRLTLWHEGFASARCKYRLE